MPEWREVASTEEYVSRADCCADLAPPMPSLDRCADGPCGWGAADELLALVLWNRYCGPSILNACCAGADDGALRLTQADDDADFHNILLVRDWTPASAANGVNALLRPTSRIIVGRFSSSGMMSGDDDVGWILRRIFLCQFQFFPAKKRETPHEIFFAAQRQGTTKVCMCE